MPKQFFQLGAVAVVFILISCSSPKYTTTLISIIIGAKKKPSIEKTFMHTEPVKEISPLLFSENDLSASLSTGVVSKDAKISAFSSMKEKAGL